MTGTSKKKKKKPLPKNGHVKHKHNNYIVHAMHIDLFTCTKFIPITICQRHTQT